MEKKSGRVWQSTVLLPKAVSISRVFPTYLWSLCEQQTHTHTVPSAADNIASSTLRVCPSSLVGILTVSRMVWGESFPARFIFKAATLPSSAPALPFIPSPFQPRHKLDFLSETAAARSPTAVPRKPPRFNQTLVQTLPHYPQEYQAGLFSPLPHGWESRFALKPD